MVCDWCQAPGREESMFGCRECNYDLCVGCYGAQRHRPHSFVAELQTLLGAAAPARSVYEPPAPQQQQQQQNKLSLKLHEILQKTGNP